MTVTYDALAAHLPKITRERVHQISRVIDLIFEPFPFLQRPAQWELSRENRRGPYTIPSYASNTIRVRLPLGYGQETVFAYGDVHPMGERSIDGFDVGFLSDLVSAGASVLKATVATKPNDGNLYSAMIEDVATVGVSRYVQTHNKLSCDMYPIIRFLTDVADSTYENQRMAYGLVFAEGSSDRCRFPEEIRTEKRFKRLSDGVSTAVYLNKQGFVEGLMDLTALRTKDSVDGTLRPRWLDSLAEATVRNANLGIALTRNGDLHILERGNYIASRRHGKWIAWNHEANIAVLQNLILQHHGSAAVVRALYAVALDLSSRRSGGLLLCLNSEDVPSIVPLSDRLGAPNRTPGDAALDRSLGTLTIGGPQSRGILVDLASLDGAMVISKSGRLMAFGSVLSIKEDGNPSDGARTKAAVAASRYGLALKVSADGDITAYHEGKPVLKL